MVRPPIGPAYRSPHSSAFCSPQLLFRQTGSAFVRVLPFGIAAAAYTLVLHLFRTCAMWPSLCPAEKLIFIHPYPLQGILILSNFSLVYRVNQSLMRYWEARSAAQNASSKWADAVLMAVAFDDEDGVGVGTLQESHEAFACCAVHLGSLLHAVAMHTLRGDRSLETLQPRRVGRNHASEASHSSLPSLAEAAAAMPPADDTAADAADAAADKSADPESGGGGGGPISSEVQRLASRQARATPRLAVSGLATSRETAAAEFARRNRIEVLGGIRPSERQKLERSEQRVYLVVGWLLRLLVRRRRRGGLSHDSPIVAASIRSSPTGICIITPLKVSDTPFPFPYAQLNGIICLLNFAFFPVVIADKTAEVVLACCISFCFICLFFMMHDVARDLEEPFTSDLGWCLGANRLHVPYLQSEYDDRILVGSGAAVNPLLESLLCHGGGGGKEEDAEEDGLEEVSWEVMASNKEAKVLGAMLADALGAKVAAPPPHAPPPDYNSRRSWFQQHEADGGVGAASGAGVEVEAEPESSVRSRSSSSRHPREEEAVATVVKLPADAVQVEQVAVASE